MFPAPLETNENFNSQSQKLVYVTASRAFHFKIKQLFILQIRVPSLGNKEGPQTLFDFIRRYFSDEK